MCYVRHAVYGRVAVQEVTRYYAMALGVVSTLHQKPGGSGDRQARGHAEVNRAFKVHI